MSYLRWKECEVKLLTSFPRPCSGDSAFADAELVAFDVRQHRGPGVSPLVLRTDQDGGAQPDEALHLGRCIVRHQIDMYPVLAGLALLDLGEEPIGAASRRRGTERAEAGDAPSSIASPSASDQKAATASGWSQSKDTLPSWRLIDLSFRCVNRSSGGRCRAGRRVHRQAVATRPRQRQVRSRLSTRNPRSRHDRRLPGAATGAFALLDTDFNGSPTRWRFADI